MTVLVGVPLRPLVTGDLPPKLSLNRAYFDAIESAGAVALPIPIVPDAGRLRHLYELVDALILPGGVDVEPSRYGAVARSDCNLNVVPELDEVEFRLAEWAMSDGLPLLGICRGIQVMNVACGGTLWQDVLVEGVVRGSDLQRWRRGVALEDGPAVPLAVDVLGRGEGGTSRVQLTFTEGRKHEVKRYCEALGHRVVRLRRSAFGPIELGRLRPGQWRMLTPREVAQLRATVV